LPTLGALAAVVLLAAGGSTGRPAAAPRRATLRPVPAATGLAARTTAAARRAPHVDAAIPTVTNAEAVAPQPTDVHLLPFAIFGAVGFAALLAIRLRREQGSYTLPWGTGSTSTRGPPLLQPA